MVNEDGKRIHCPECGSKDVDLVGAGIWMGSGWLEVDVLDATWEWNDDPEPGGGYKVPSIAVYLKCACGMSFNHTYGDSVERFGVSFEVTK